MIDQEPLSSCDRAEHMLILGAVGIDSPRLMTRVLVTGPEGFNLDLRGLSVDQAIVALRDFVKASCVRDPTPPADPEPSP